MPRAATGYRSLLRTPGAAAFFFTAAVGRVGIAMTGLGLVWLLHARTGSYGTAGLAAAGFALAEALIGPQLARLIGIAPRHGASSSWPPPTPWPRWRPTASISSIKMIQGADFFPCSNMSRTRDAPTPTNISTKSEPLIEKNGTSASPAMARASNVLPVPGGPTMRTPFGMRPPSF